MLKLEITKQGIRKAEIYPIISNNKQTKFQPQLMETEASNEYLNKYAKKSEINDKKLRIENGVGIIDFK